ncbi:MAG: 3'-5' exonuclease [Candidatus Saganbacteria bacterium]|nr:3'-5' exonuclease [Candidatus Saganbacteria bacterium]
MYNQSEYTEGSDFKKLEKDYPFLRHAKGDENEDALEKGHYSIIDIETTGLEPSIYEIIEIAALRVENNDIKDIFNTLITPSKEITQEIEHLTGISNQMVSGYPTIEKVLPRFLDFIGNSILIAHNTDFDVTFLNTHIKKHLDRNLENLSICTLKISRKFLPGLSRHKLHSVADYYKVPTPLLHRALADAEITYQIWLKLIETIKKSKILTVKELLKVL